MIESEIASRKLVEITGVAGSGKSTVTSILVEGPFSRAPFISAREPRQAVLFLRSLPRLVPILVGNFRSRPRMTWADFKLMVYVSSWNHHLDAIGLGENLVFDQGPLYALVRLRAKGIGVADSTAFSRWWSQMLAKWLEEISVVVWLDADDAALIGRLNSRDQRHDLKGAPEDEGREFLARYRSLFDEIAARIEKRERPNLIRIDTGDLRPVDVARVVTEFVIEDRSTHE